MSTDRDNRQGLPSASSAAKWMNCAASFGREALEPDSDTPESLAGTRLHEAMEGKIALEALSEEEIDLVTLARELEQEAVMTCIGEKAVPVFLEKRLYFKDVCSARLDKAWAANPPDGALLVIDWKFGRVAPEAIESNQQMRVQAVCALAEGINRIFVAVIAPRLPKGQRLTICEYSKDDLFCASAQVDAAASIAIKQKNDPQDFHAGPWCEHCKFRAKCEAAQGKVSELATLPVKASELSTERLTQMLSLCDMAENVIESVRQEAITRLLAGHEVAGWKMPEPKRTRTLADAQAVYSALSESLSPEQFASVCKVTKGKLEELYFETNHADGETKKQTLARLNAILEPLTTVTINAVHKPVRI